MKNNFESMADMQRMQQEAVRRVHDMQRRAKQTLIAGESATPNKASSNNNCKENSAEDTEKTQQSPCNDEKSRSSKNQMYTQLGKGVPSNSNFFSAFANDPEKRLIFLLILLLVDEGTDISLIFALMYLLI